MRVAAIAAALVIALAAPALADDVFTANLDGDAAEETVTVVRAEQVTVKITDTCPSGSTVERQIAGPQAKLGGLQKADADGLPGEEVLVHLRSGPVIGGKDEVRLVAWRALQGEPCAEPRTLWSWFGAAPMPRKRHARYAGFTAALAEVTKNFPGDELVLNEYFADSRHTLRKANLARRSIYRYSDSTEKYVRYFRRVITIRR
jgi:hypothetical protein